MGSESHSPRYNDVCHQYANLYDYFLDNASGEITSISATATSSTSTLTPDRSMLVTGFGLRHWDSLERALLDDEQRRQMLLAQHGGQEYVECEESGFEEETSDTMTAGPSRVSLAIPDQVRSLSLEYLMGIAKEDEPCEEELPQKIETMRIEEVEELEPQETAAMKKARLYLKNHKISEFFQFLLAHLASHVPENPIEHVVTLLDKCLLYRSGRGEPPLLFKKEHIEQLFNLMDPMRTGFIESEQYKTGMKTLGIHTFDTNPQLSTEGLISKEIFIEEAYESLTDQLAAMISFPRDDETVLTVTQMTPPPTEISFKCVAE